MWMEEGGLCLTERASPYKVSYRSGFGRGMEWPKNSELNIFINPFLGAYS